MKHIIRKLLGSALNRIPTVDKNAAVVSYNIKVLQSEVNDNRRQLDQVESDRKYFNFLQKSPNSVAGLFFLRSFADGSGSASSCLNPSQLSMVLRFLGRDEFLTVETGQNITWLIINKLNCGGCKVS